MWGRDGQYLQQNPQGAFRGRRSVLPPTDELAEMLRDGHSTEDIAAIYSVAPTTVDAHLKRGGYHPRTGQPRDQVVDDTTDEVDLAALVAKVFPGAWVADALCSQTDPDAFYPEKGGSTLDAKAVCAGCPVAAECLDYALANGERYGIWGGLSERERRKLERGLPIEPRTRLCPACGEEFRIRRGTQRYCSKHCQEQAKHERSRIRTNPTEEVA